MKKVAIVLLVLFIVSGCVKNDRDDQTCCACKDAPYADVCCDCDNPYLNK